MAKRQSPRILGSHLQVKRRLAQNREAARKSRARKKEYLKRLELEVCISVPAAYCHGSQVLDLAL